MNLYGNERMVWLDLYSVEVRYTGKLEEYTDHDLREMAIAKTYRGVDAFDRTTLVPYPKAVHLQDMEVTEVEDFPCNHLARVHWALIREDSED